MFGNVMNNQAICQAVKNKSIEIKPFDEKRLKTCHYPLHPAGLKQIGENGTESRFFDFSPHGDDTVELPPKKYLIVEIQERLCLEKGIVGRFIPSSSLIERGILMLAGRLEHPFGEKGENVRFGIYNSLDVPTTLSSKGNVAYVEFVDFRGLNNLPVETTLEEFALWQARLRRAADDGPNYEE